MAYTINKTNGQQLLSLLDGTVNDQYQVKLVGKNYINYGTAQNENFIYLLENFANDIAPLYPLTGQLWYNTTANTLSYYDGSTFMALANVTQLGAGVSTLRAELIANVAILQSQITANNIATTANAASQHADISNLWANATIQNVLGLVAAQGYSNATSLGSALSKNTRSNYLTSTLRNKKWKN
jgi:hypothetical protein